MQVEIFHAPENSEQSGADGGDDGDDDGGDDGSEESAAPASASRTGAAAAPVADRADVLRRMQEQIRLLQVDLNLLLSASNKV